VRNFVTGSEEISHVVAAANGLFLNVFYAGVVGRLTIFRKIH